MSTAVYDGVTIEVSEPRTIPINWITFRCHPCTDFSGVEMYLKGELEWKPIIVCKSCWTLLDGWHRLAAAWRRGDQPARDRYEGGRDRRGPGGSDD